MGFLDKIGLKKHDDKSDLPPPPPSGKKTEMKPPQSTPKPPESNISDLPNRSSLPKLPSEPPKMDSPNQDPQQDMPPPVQKPVSSQENSQPPSNQPVQKSPAPSDQSAQKQQPPVKKNLSREELRDAFNDVPPIKSAPKTPQTPIDDAAADNFDVDSMVLPEGEEDESAPAVQPAPTPTKSEPQPQESSPDLYISVEKYDDIQHRISDLKKQVSDAGSSIDHILDGRKKEDDEFSDFIKDLERIQEDLISIDEDLFTKR